MSAPPSSGGAPTMKSTSWLPSFLTNKAHKNGNLLQCVGVVCK
jgi:hypothetical protein